MKALLLVGLIAGAMGTMVGSGGDSEPTSPDTIVPASPPGNPDRGARLFERLDCIRCHTAPRSERGVNIPTDLSITGSRSREPWLSEYLLDPRPIRYRSEGVLPGLRMPALVKHREDARDLAAFLLTEKDTSRVPEMRGMDLWLADTTLARAGADLFDQYQCRGCHELGGTGNKVGPALDEVGYRRRPEYVYRILLDPDAVVPGTSMENKELWDEEARAITAYLVSRSHRYCGVDAASSSDRSDLSIPKGK